MFKVKVVDVRNFDASTMPEAHVEAISRPSILGNPYYLNNKANATERAEVIKKYHMYLDQHRKDNSKVWQEVVRLAVIAQTQPVVLTCFCAPEPCHGNIIARAMAYINSILEHKGV